MAKKDEIVSSTFYNSIRNIIIEARKKAYRAINLVQVHAYWDIGRLIVEEEQKGEKRAEYGKYLLKGLSERLGDEFGEGYTERNLRYMRAFYLNFPIRHAARSESIEERRKALPPELSWTHYRILLKVKNPEEKIFYMNECIENQWPTRYLERQINSLLYQRLLVSREKKELLKAVQKESRELEPKHIIKDPYILDFLGIKENTKLIESDLETALMDKLQEFLLELGKGFSFVARQKRITTETQHFYIDLVFYNYLLRCFVLIDLKVGKLTHQDIGQMDMYVRIFEKKIKSKGDNPTIGIILCNEKDDTIVKYSFLEESKQLFASKYMLYLPTEKELAEELQREIELIKSEKKLNEGI